ncbi:MAG: serine/threonine-protein kinase, partial [Acidobacteriota bacterium]
MPSPRWRQIDDLFQAAVTLAGEARDRLLDHECSDDAELRQQVEELLAAHDRAATFLERPAGAGLTVGESDVGGSDVGGSHAGGSDAEVCWVGRRLGPYEILSELGRGGMSIVYLAQRVDHELESQVAIKRLAPPQATVSLARRFRVERQILARLDHPGIARILDAGTTEEGTPYFVMERIEGEPIDIYCDRRRLGLSKRLELFRRVCVAVAYAHRNLVVHRDLKPKNILVTAAGEPKLLDFGIAKLLAPENFPQRVEETSTRLRPMTPRYASPEQAAGEPINTASDVYSLAVLLYELLTGRSPYTLQGRTASEIEAILQHEVPPPPSEALASADEGGAAAAAVRGARPEALRRALAGDLDRVVLCALHKEAEERYGSVERFSDDLGRYIAGRPIRARPDSRFYRLRKFVRRHLVSVATAGVVAVVLLVFATVTVLQARRIERERDGARRQQLRAEEVTTFLLDVFGEVDPSRSRGERVTAREVLDRGARRVEQQLAGEPELQATLMHTLGDVYGSLGLYEPARRLLDQATENRRRLLGGDHPAVAESLHARGEVLLEQGNMAAAEAVATEALEIHRKRQPEGAAEAAASGGIPRSLDLLGRIRRVAGDRQEAIALHTQALELRRQSGSAVDGEHIRGLSFLAAAHRAAGDLASSAAVYRQALDLQRELQAGDHPVLAEILHNLAVVLRRQGDLDEAEATCRSALAINRRLYGERHSSLARNLNS